MIEAYAFLAMFAVQILMMSVMHIVWLIKFLRSKLSELPDEYFAKAGTGIDRNQSVETFVTVYRMVQTVIALLSFLLLGWLFNYMQRPNWSVSAVSLLSVAQFLLTMLPLAIMALYAFARDGSKVFKAEPPESKRKAVLQRRGLFDFVAPFSVAIAVAVYFVFVGFVIYSGLKPLATLASIGGVTVLYVLTAFEVYWTLYGKKWDRYETNADRAHRIGVGVKGSIYGCIETVAFVSFVIAMDARWLPFGLSASFVIAIPLIYMQLALPPRKPEADPLGDSPAH